MKSSFLLLGLCLLANLNDYSRIVVRSKHLTYEIYDCNFLDSNDGQLAAMISGGFPPYEYIWHGPDDFFSTDSLITNLPPGFYHLSVSDGLCGHLSDSIEVFALNKKLEKEDFIIDAVYPNPCLDHVNLSLSTSKAQIVTIRLSDMKGAVLLEEIRHCLEGTQNLKMHFQDIQPGLYQISIHNSSNQIKTHKLTIMGSL